MSIVPERIHMRARMTIIPLMSDLVSVRVYPPLSTILLTTGVTDEFGLPGARIQNRILTQSLQMTSPLRTTNAN